MQMHPHRSTALRALRWPRLWLGVWAALIVLVIVLSLLPKPPIPPTLTIGKLDHLIAYLVLAAFAVQLYLQRRAQLVAAVALVLLGIALELAQGYLTTDRHMSGYDALIDTLGVALGTATAWTPLATALLRFERMVARALR